MTTRYTGPLGSVTDIPIRDGLVRLDENLGRVEDAFAKFFQNGVMGALDSPGEESTAFKVNKHIRLRDNKFLYWTPVGVEGVTNRSAGIRWHVAGVSPDRMEFDVGTSTKMMLNSRGQVGIGVTTLPGGTEHLLTIASGAATGSIMGYPTSATGRPTIQFWIDTTPTTAVSWGNSIPGSGAATADGIWCIYASSAWSEKMRLVNATGHLLIGSATDTATQGQLQVHATGSTAAATLLSSGNGVSALVWNKVAAPSSDPQWLCGMVVPGGLIRSNDLCFGKQAGGASFTETMRLVNATGNVLIGTTGDSARLTVQGAIELATVQISGNSLSGTTAVTMLGLTQTWTTTGIAKGIVQNITHTGSTAGTGVLMDLQIGGTSKFKVRVDQTAASGALGSSALSFIDLAHTWNTTANPTAFKQNVTNTASGTTAKLFDWQVGGTSMLNLFPNGLLNQTVTAGGFHSVTWNVSGAALQGLGVNITGAIPTTSFRGFEFAMTSLSGTATTMYGFNWDNYLSSAGGTTYAGLRSNFQPTDAVTWTTARLCDLSWGNSDGGNGSTTTITNLIGVHVHDAGFEVGDPNFITNQYGVLVEASAWGATNFHAAAFDGNVNLTNDKTLYWGTATSTAWASRAAGITYDTTSTRLIVDRGGVSRVGFDGTAINLGTGFSLDWRAACTTTTAARGRFLYQTTGEQFEFYANASANASLIVNNNLVTVRTALAPNGDNAAVIGSQSLRWTELGVIKILSGASALALATDDGANTTTTRLSISAGAAGATVTVSDAVHFAFSTTGTGTKLGTGTTQLIGVWNAAPVARQSAYTQTYATADKTHAALTSATLTDNTGGTAGTTLAAIVGGGAACETTTKNAVASLSAQVNALRVDLEDAKQLINSVIDDFQTIGWLA